MERGDILVCIDGSYFNNQVYLTSGKSYICLGSRLSTIVTIKSDDEIIREYLSVRFEKLSDIRENKLNIIL